ncbi:hypothetical protein CK218_20145 [Mesorhizobium sp. WSM3879]|nr:hypothetical protein CK218_20145 [Mesorhizobium sp. WSM3879]
MDAETEKLFAHLTADPTGQLHDGLRLVDKYLEAVQRQHALIFEAWRQKRYERALVELHFFLIAIDRVKDGIVLASSALGTRWPIIGGLGTYQDIRGQEIISSISRIGSMALERTR